MWQLLSLLFMVKLKTTHSTQEIAKYYLYDIICQQSWKKRHYSNKAGMLMRSNGFPSTGYKKHFNQVTLGKTYHTSSNIVNGFLCIHP